MKEEDQYFWYEYTKKEVIRWYKANISLRSIKE